jgi:hypothetical protein
MVHLSVDTRDGSTQKKCKLQLKKFYMTDLSLQRKGERKIQNILIQKYFSFASYLRLLNLGPVL